MNKVIGFSLLSSAVSVALGAAWSVASVSTAAAKAPADHDRTFVCANDSLEGNYGFTLTGTRPAMPGGPGVAVVGTALTTFNGDGTLTQIDNIHVDSAAVPFQPDRPGTGTYTLNPDCSGEMTLLAGGGTLRLSIVVVDHGREIRTAVITPHVLVTSHGRKI